MAYFENFEVLFDMFPRLDKKFTHKIFLRSTSNTDKYYI